MNLDTITKYEQIRIDKLIKQYHPCFDVHKFEVWFINLAKLLNQIKKEKYISKKS